MGLSYDELDKSLAKHYYKLLSEGLQAHINNIDEENNVEIKIRKNCPSCPLDTNVFSKWLFDELKKDIPKISSIKII